MEHSTRRHAHHGKRTTQQTALQTDTPRSPTTVALTAPRDVDHRREREEPTTQAAVPLAYRIPQAASALGVGKTTLYELFKVGALKPIRIGGRTLVPLDQLRQLIAEAPPALPSK